MPLADLEALANSLSSFNLNGRRAFVTGAARGIGAAITWHLLAAGARVVAVDKDKETLAGEFDGIDECQCLGQDISEGDMGQFAAQLTADEPVELVVNNVGITTPASWWDATAEDMDRAHAVNQRNLFLLTRDLTNRLVELGRPGAVVFVSSLHSGVPCGEPQYSATKAALVQTMREGAHALGPHGIRVNAVSPGWIRTVADPNSWEQREKQRTFTPAIPMGRPGPPEDVARAVLWLLSDFASFVNGVYLEVDGGMHLQTWRPRRRHDAAN